MRSPMSLEEDLANTFSGSELDGDTILTIGVFDGVHLGHKHLIAKLKEGSGKLGLLSGVVTFDPPPQKVLSSHDGPMFITSIEDRIELLSAEKIDAIFIIPFTEEIAGLSAGHFICLLQKYLKMKGLVVGDSFALGRNREGSSEKLRKLGDDMGFMVTLVPPLVINGEVVSSTLIRKALSAGSMKTVYDLIGRFFSLRGKVVPGASRGAGLGYPTANLNIDKEQLLPATGVYASWVYIDDEIYGSMAYIGTVPTFSHCKSVVEVFILDYSGDLYGKDLKVDFVERLRDEKQFDSADSLRHQITVDIEKGRALLGAVGDK
jgi:riboflavin kinase/FMN adenylyltransferase